jgi:tRNA A37 threonylcarbamoyladenosine dehydratase
MMPFFDAGMARINPSFLRITSIMLTTPRRIAKIAANRKRKEEKPVCWTSVKKSYSGEQVKEKDRQDISAANHDDAPSAFQCDDRKEQENKNCKSTGVDAVKKRTGENKW